MDNVICEILPKKILGLNVKPVYPILEAVDTSVSLPHSLIKRERNIAIGATGGVWNLKKKKMVFPGTAQALLINSQFHRYDILVAEFLSKNSFHAGIQTFNKVSKYTKKIFGNYLSAMYPM